MESDGITFVDSRQAYVFRIPKKYVALITCRAHNKAGAGKSTLLYVMTLLVFSGLSIARVRSAIIHDIERVQIAGLATMAYYYFDFRDGKKQDCYGLLFSLVSQLSSKSDSCFNILSELYSENSRGVQKPDIDELKSCLTDILSQPAQAPIYLIVDGLDECPNSSGMLSARQEILDLIEELVILNLSNVHLCVASRDAAVRFGPVQGHFPPNLKPDRRSGSPNSLNPELDLDEPVQMVRFRFRVI